MFTGFTPATGEFLGGLLVNNEKPWFEAHRTEFERDLKKPFQELALETADALRQRFPDRDYQLHIARIYRDARRLFGRGPYKDHLWFSIKQNQGLLSGAMFWFEVGALDYSWGMGFYDAGAAQMAAYRQAVLAAPSVLTRLAEAFSAQDRFQLEGPEYKRPKVSAGPLLDPWLNRKYLSLCRRGEFGPDLFDPKLPMLLAEDFAFLTPYYDFLRQFGQPEDPRACRENNKTT